METSPARAASDRRRRARQAWQTRLRGPLRALRWPLAVTIAATALLLGVLGHRAIAPSADAGYWLYRSLQLFALDGGEVPNAPATLQVARLLAPAVAGYAVWQALSAVFGQQLTRLRIRYLRDHVIVCGLGDKGRLLAQSLLESGYRVVAIDHDVSADPGGLLRDGGLILLTGDARESTMLHRAGVARARYLLAVGPEDGTNAEVIGQLGDGGPQRSSERPLTAFVHMVSTDLTALLRATVAPGSAALRLEFFNIYDSAARALVSDVPPFATPAGYAGVPHLLLIGFGDLSRSALRLAGLQWQNDDTAGARPRVTVLDPNATSAVARFARGYPAVARACDLVACDIADTAGGPTRDDVENAVRNAPAATAAFICLDSDADALTTGLTVSPLLGPTGGPVVVALWEAAQLGALVASASGGGLARLHPFAVLPRTCSADLVLGGLHEVLARAFHSGYVENSPSGPAGATVPWDELPPALQESNRRAADSVREALAAVGCRIAPLTDVDAEVALQPGQVEVLARMEHERWRHERLELRWTLGPRDVERRRSPLLVPWDDLPDEARDYNRRWAQSLPEHLHASGLQIAKLE